MRAGRHRCHWQCLLSILRCLQAQASDHSTVGIGRLVHVLVHVHGMHSTTSGVPHRAQSTQTALNDTVHSPKMPMFMVSACRCGLCGTCRHSVKVNVQKSAPRGHWTAFYCTLLNLLYLKKGTKDSQSNLESSTEKTFILVLNLKRG